MKTLKLFNAVVEKDTKSEAAVRNEGFIIDAKAIWAEKEIIQYYANEALNGNNLNKTFHKSWKIIRNSSRSTLLMQQILHYISTYGSDFKAEMYIPDEVLNLPDVKLKYKVIKAYSVDEMTIKCLALLQAGIALKEETINDLLTILVDELSYTFTGTEGIRNKEAIIKIADLYGVLPDNTMEFFRYIIYRATGDSLLIKSRTAIQAIKDSNYNPGAQFQKFGLDRLSVIFNRFKPLFLAFKGKCPKTINKISKLSKKNHEVMVTNPLNMVTSIKLTKSDKHWLDNATPFALFKALSACYTRMNGQSAFVYMIRNGKSWTREKKTSKVNKGNYKFILKYLKKRFDLSDKKVFFPEDIKFAMPTSEKMFVGNIPIGTRFYGKKLAVGIYWENSWGASDLDLSGQNIGGKIGWNATYNQGEGDLMFSGDITNAPTGAVEYLYANNGLASPTLVKNNVYSGDDEAEFKIIIGKGDKVSKDYMFNPDNLFAEMKCKSVQKESILGIFIPKKERQCFVLLNFGAGQARVSGSSEIATIATKALYQQWNKAISFNKIVLLLGAKIVKQKKADYDFTLDTLEKDSFINFFKLKT